jgi:hypothetical protein
MTKGGSLRSCDTTSVPRKRVFDSSSHVPSATSYPLHLALDEAFSDRTAILLITGFSPPASRESALASEIIEYCGRSESEISYTECLCDISV